MKLKILFFIFFYTGWLIFLPTTTVSGAGSCCVCNFWDGTTEAPDKVRLSEEETLITNATECDDYDEVFMVNPNDPASTQINRCEIKESAVCVTPIPTKLTDEIKFSNIILGVRIPNLHFSAPPTEIDQEGNIYIPWIGEYIKALYSFSMIAISTIAVVMIIVQGLRISTSAGGPAKADATKKIGQAVIGLILAWGSYVILFVLNPELTQFRSLDIRFIDRVPSIDLIEDEPLITIPDTVVNNVPDLKQFDKRWGGEIFGYNSRVCECGTKNNPGPDRSLCSKSNTECCTTIQAGGCGPTSLAMILRAYGETAVTPLETANFVGTKGNGRICNKGTDFNTVVKKLSDGPWPGYSGKAVSQNEAYELLKKGKPIVFLCSNCTGKSKTGTKSYKGHYMVLTGLAGGGTIDEEYSVMVNDPGANVNKAIITMTKSQLLDNNGFWYVYKQE